MKSICLNMIVKNERRVIRRCLEALKEHIDYWVIVDTGSTDGTQELIKECLRGYPGELHERPWHNFEHNRNEALRLAENKMDYILFVDADEIIHFSPDFNKDRLDQDYYLIKTVAADLEFYIVKLIKDDSLWNWVQVIHEFIQHTGDVSGEKLKTIWTESVQDGARSKDPEKMKKDIEILQAAIKKDPQNARYVFYLAQTYKANKNKQKALETYQIRAKMNGEKDETFWALFCVAQLQEELGFNPLDYLKSYDRAYQFDPTRAEPLERMASYYFQNEFASTAYSLMKHAQTLPTPNPLTCGYLAWVYDFAVYSICADCAMDLGKFKEAEMMYLNIFRKDKAPPGLIPHIQKQLKKIENLLGENLTS